MPGKVIKLLVSEGSEVEANQGIIVLEAMKMQSTVYAPVAGKVTRKLAHPGQTVDAKELLLVIE